MARASLPSNENGPVTSTVNSSRDSHDTRDRDDPGTTTATFPRTRVP